MNFEILLGGGSQEGTQMDYGYILFTIGLEFDWSILTSCFAGLGLKIIYFLLCKIAITTKQAENTLICGGHFFPVPSLHMEYYRTQTW